MAEEELFPSLLGCLGSRAGWELARCRVSAGLSNCGQGASTPSPLSEHGHHERVKESAGCSLKRQRWCSGGP